MRTKRFPLKPIYRIAKNVGIKRLSKDAANEIRDVLVSDMENIVKNSILFMEHAGRKTVLLDDVKLAVRRFYNE